MAIRRKFKKEKLFLRLINKISIPLDDIKDSLIITPETVRFRWNGERRLFARWYVENAGEINDKL